MKASLLLLFCSLSLMVTAQTYKVGLIKEGAAIKNIEGQIVITDSVIISSIAGVESRMKITKRSGFTFHVIEGTTPSRYVITHTKGKLHGFAYDRAVKHEREHHQTKIPVVVYYCALQND